MKYILRFALFLIFKTVYRNFTHVTLEEAI